MGWSSGPTTCTDNLLLMKVLMVIVMRMVETRPYRLEVLIVLLLLLLLLLVESGGLGGQEGLLSR